MALRILGAMAASFLLALLFGGRFTAWDGVYLDALLRMKEPVPVAPELLLVSPDTPAQQGSIGASRAVELMWTLAELRADYVLLPSSWNLSEITDAGALETTSDVSSRLNEEFDRIDENIAELFEAIRIGSIDPREADRFVDELRQLIRNSESRIQDSLTENGGASGISVEGMIDVFGSDRVGYTLSDVGMSLPSYPSAVAMPVPPQRDPPQRDGDVPEFRRLPYSLLSRYMSLSNRLAMHMSALEENGHFDEVEPRNRPRAILEDINSLRSELYEQPAIARAEAWRAAVDDYFEAVAGLIDADTQARLIARLETLKEGGNLEEDITTNIREMQQQLVSDFATVREDYAVVTALRKELSQAVGGSFVILHGQSGEDARALVANSILVGEHLYAPVGRNRTLLLMAAGLLLGVILSPFRLHVVLLLSPAVLLLVATLFPVLLLVKNIWVDPVSAVVALVGANVAVIIIIGQSQRRVERALTGRAVERLPPGALRRAFLRGTLPRGEVGLRRAAVVVVASESTDGSRDDELRLFHRAVSKRIRYLGGVVLGEDGATVCAAFSDFRADDARLARNTCAAVKELLSTPFSGGVSIRCGVEVGELLFYTSPIGGYRASGSAIRYARRLCELTKKHQQRALFGESVFTACDDSGGSLHFQERGKLATNAAGGRYAFYCLREIGPPSP